MWPYPWTHVGTPSHLGHMDRVAATMPSQAHAGAAQEAPDIGQWEGQDVPLVRPSSCNVKGGIPSSRRYLPTYLPDSNSSVDSWVDEVRSKGKGTRCPSCGECAKDCSCRRQISSLENRVKELKKAAKEKKRDDDSKWKEMEQKLEKLTDLVQNLSTTGLSGPAPTMASHPAPTSSAAPTSTPYGVPHSAAPPSFYWPPSSFYWNFWYPPYWIWKSYWVQSGY